MTRPPHKNTGKLQIGNQVKIELASRPGRLTAKIVAIPDDTTIAVRIGNNTPINIHVTMIVEGPL